MGRGRGDAVELEELLVDEGVADVEAFQRAREVAGREGRALASVLVEDAGVPEDVLAELMARALGTVVIDVELGALDTESVRLVPEALARRHLLVPVARGAGGGALRVAFANPLDEDAIHAVREHTGLEVEAMVATVSGVREAIEREYGRRDTRVIRNPRPRGELAAEDTRRVELPEARGEGRRGRPVTTDSDLPLSPTGTAPTHRLEQSASIEQRHEALLLALVEAGILTRSDYLAALQRLMGKR